VVATTVALPTGSARDPDGASGTTWLLAEVILAQIEDRLGPAAVSLEARVTRNHTVLQVLTVPEAWPRAYRALDGLLLGDEALDPSVVEEVRERRRAILTFASGSPARTFDVEMHELLTRATDPWSRDPGGTRESLDAITAAVVSAHRERVGRRADAVVSVVGAAPAHEVARELAEIGPGGIPSSVPGPPGSLVAVGPAPSGPAPAPWTTGERLRRVREVTSGWIAAAFPLAPGAEPTALEFLLHRIRHELVTDPPPPGLFSADLVVEELPDGGRVLLIEAAVFPEDMEPWEERIVETVQELAAHPLPPESGFVQWHRRRFRSERLLWDAAPEEEGRRVAFDLLHYGRVRDLQAEIWALSRDALVEAGATVGEPRVLVFGPDLSASPDR
jgi:hypothetical protein